jgi:hypothetical protein
MRIGTVQGGFVIVIIEPEDTAEFNRHWPCSPIPDGARIIVELDSRNGDLVNITMNDMDKYGEYLDSANYDGDALLALTHDANNFAVDGGILPQWARR